MDIRFNIVKKGEEQPRVVPFGHPQEASKRSTVHLEGTPELVLRLLDEVTKYVDTIEDLVIV